MNGIPERIPAKPPPINAGMNIEGRSLVMIFPPVEYYSIVFSFDNSTFLNTSVIPGMKKKGRMAPHMIPVTNRIQCDEVQSESTFAAVSITMGTLSQIRSLTFGTDSDEKPRSKG